MNAFVAYSIPIQGLKLGLHQFKFSIDDTFFAHFEDSPVETGQIDFVVELDKRSDMMLFDFELSARIFWRVSARTENSSGISLPAARALSMTGSKSTNQDLNKACAIASNVSFILRLTSILSSNDPRIWAIFFCSASSGRHAFVDLLAIGQHLGQVGLGLLKLFTCGGLGIWTIIDVVLIAMRKITDDDGLPLG